MTVTTPPPLALVTGGSLGLGRALAGGLADAGWSLIVTGRDAAALDAARAQLLPRLSPAATVTAVPGDVADPDHRAVLAATVQAAGRLDLLVNNASILGPSPQPRLADYPLDELRAVFEVNVLAPLALLQALAPWLEKSDHARVVNVTSDAAVSAYEGWGGYGSSKAALEQLSAIWAAESPWCTTWAVDPGDLRTRMHQEAFPGEDISDRPPPEAVVPGLVGLIGSDTPSGRVRLADLQPGGAVS